MTRPAMIAVVLLGGCDLGLGSDPYAGLAPRPCDPGHDRAEGPCALPIGEVVIDGDLGDWAAIDPLPIDAVCVDAECPALPAEIRLARIPLNPQQPGDLVLAMDGLAPPVDPSMRWVLRFTETPELPVSTAIDELVLAEGDASWWKNGHQVSDAGGAFPPWVVGATATGFEARIAGDWLPFAGAALLTIVAERSVDGAWVPVTMTAAMPACWMALPFWNPDPCAEPRP